MKKFLSTLFAKPGDPNAMDNPETASAWAAGNLNSKKNVSGLLSYLKDTTRSLCRSVFNITTSPLQVAYATGTAAVAAPSFAARVGIGVTDIPRRGYHIAVGKPLGLLRSFYDKFESALFGNEKVALAGG